MAADHPAADGAQPGTDELDRLIGELEGEAARRRSEPDFPLAADGRIRYELDRLSPGGVPGASELVRAVLDAGGHRPAPAASPRRRLRAVIEDRLPSSNDALAMATGVALQVLFDRTALVRPAVARAPGQDHGSLLDTWAAELVVRPRSGQVVCGGAGGPFAAERLAAQGYEIDLVEGGADAVARDLAALPPASRAVLLVEVACRHPGELAELVAALARTASGVEVLGVAPWWWRRSRSTAESELAAVRPLPPDLWIEELTGAGFTCTARYDAAGRSYEVIAERQEDAGA